MDLSTLLQSMTQQAGQPESPLFGPTMPFAQQAPPPMGPQPEAMAAPGLPTGPPPEAPAPLGVQSQQGPDWKAQLPMLLTALAGLAGAGHNQFGAAAYLRGFQETQDQQAQMAAQQAELAHRAALERQARADRIAKDDEERKRWIATTMETLLAKPFDTPEDRTAYFQGLKGPLSRLGIDTSQLATLPMPGEQRKLQTDAGAAVKTALDTLGKQGIDLADPAALDGVTVKVRGRDVPLPEAAKLAGVPLASPTAPRKAPGGDSDFNRYLAESEKVAEASLGRPLNAGEKLQLDETARRKWATLGWKPSVIQTSGTTISPNARKIAKGIIEHRIPPDIKGFYRDKAGIVAALEDQGFDLSQAALEYQDVQNSLKTKDNAQFARQRNNVAFLQHQMPLLRQAVKAWIDTGYATRYPDINTLTIAANLKGLDPGAQRAAIALNRIIADMNLELSNVYAGGNAPTDQQLKQAQENIHTNWSPEALDDAVTFMERNLGYRAQIIQQMGPSMTGNRYAPTPAPATPPAGSKKIGRFLVEEAP